MRLEAARYEAGELIFKAPPEARGFVYSFKPGEYDIIPHKEKRSNDANALMWALCRDIAEAVNRPALEIYRNAIKDVGVYKDFILKEDDAKTIKTAWENLGLGWVTEQVDYDQDGERIILRCWYGSSKYNKKQMSRLIDNLMQDAESIGIPPRAQSGLNPFWRRGMERNGYSPSIIQERPDRCFLCGATTGKLDRHEPFGGAYRAKSKRLGMWVLLCHEPCHLSVVHKFPAENRKLRKLCQERAMEAYGWTTKDFIREFGKNYLEELC